MKNHRIKQRQTSRLVCLAIDVARLLIVQLIAHSWERRCPCILSIYFVTSVSRIDALLVKDEGYFPELRMSHVGLGDGNARHREAAKVECLL